MTIFTAVSVDFANGVIEIAETLDQPIGDVLLIGSMCYVVYGPHRLVCMGPTRQYLTRGIEP